MMQGHAASGYYGDPYGTKGGIVDRPGRRGGTVNHLSFSQEFDRAIRIHNPIR